MVENLCDANGSCRFSFGNHRDTRNNDRIGGVNGASIEMDCVHRFYDQVSEALTLLEASVEDVAGLSANCISSRDATTPLFGVDGFASSSADAAGGLAPAGAISTFNFPTAGVCVDGAEDCSVAALVARERLDLQRREDGSGCSSPRTADLILHKMKLLQSKLAFLKSCPAASPSGVAGYSLDGAPSLASCGQSASGGEEESASEMSLQVSGVLARGDVKQISYVTLPTHGGGEEAGGTSGVQYTIVALPSPLGTFDSADTAAGDRFIEPRVDAPTSSASTHGSVAVSSSKPRARRGSSRGREGDLVRSEWAGVESDRLFKQRSELMGKLTDLENRRNMLLRLRRTREEALQKDKIIVDRPRSRQRGTSSSPSVADRRLSRALSTEPQEVSPRRLVPPLALPPQTSVVSSRTQGTSSVSTPFLRSPTKPRRTSATATLASPQPNASTPRIKAPSSAGHGGAVVTLSPRASATQGPTALASPATPLTTRTNMVPVSVSSAGSAGQPLQREVNASGNVSHMPAENLPPVSAVSAFANPPANLTPRSLAGQAAAALATSTLTTPRRASTASHAPSLSTSVSSTVDAGLQPECSAVSLADASHAVVKGNVSSVIVRSRAAESPAGVISTTPRSVRRTSPLRQRRACSPRARPLGGTKPAIPSVLAVCKLSAAVP
eukprot:TRINITY_DN56273_c0_g1_i1.p1 TRINITY_DN56273_c0_g1~~TRINITY_DN56273_c0_g1_i1.p1  ORF type:complete len:670 (-),score=89.89 TRINITY_DN56273_c0_g1_i1:290-2299(-)